MGEEDFFDERKKLDIIKKYGCKAAITDFAILLGGYVCPEGCYTFDDYDLEDRTCYYWTRTSDGDGDARIVSYDGNAERGFSVETRNGAVRPALLSSVICNTQNGVRGNSGVLEVEYGEYPINIFGLFFITS